MLNLFTAFMITVECVSTPCILLLSWVSHCMFVMGRWECPRGGTRYCIQTSHFKILCSSQEICCCCPWGIWLSCQQTWLQEQHTEDEQINRDPWDFTPDTIPDTTLPVNPGLGLAPEYSGLYSHLVFWYICLSGLVEGTKFMVVMCCDGKRWISWGYVLFLQSKVVWTSLNETIV